MNKKNIAILTTVANFDLYKVTSQHFPKDIRKYVIDGRNGMHGIHSIFYMYRKLVGKEIDWLILADEDVIFKESEMVFSVIEKMQKENIFIAGVRDGGVISHRQYNPFVVNTFFTIINFKELVFIWDKNEIKNNQYLLPSEFKIEEKLHGKFDVNSLYEPYYCFFLWLKRMGKKFLLLDANMLGDKVSNNICFNEKIFAYHTWYARSYGVNKKHTDRINAIMKELNISLDVEANDRNMVVFKDSFFYSRMKVKKFIKRLVNKLYG